MSRHDLPHQSNCSASLQLCWRRHHHLALEQAQSTSTLALGVNFLRRNVSRISACIQPASFGAPLVAAVIAPPYYMPLVHGGSYPKRKLLSSCLLSKQFRTHPLSQDAAQTFTYVPALGLPLPYWHSSRRPTSTRTFFIYAQNISSSSGFGNAPEPDRDDLTFPSLAQQKKPFHLPERPRPAIAAGAVISVVS